ncbi:hypothetical protein BU25DRAFT_214413 [Macroventuria anomochaeta]|uniref:Uncharacterized protein n=1 Tax=Macroventuria anomochaeta TaxID=301207 RepID=A0ACB6RK12_9PLEO|nr:uncharacterized protein BU25DRAFT_214413 [Macroventuria anomochaeta]KAF2622295.1 hypothetical protein BU25DRAFT_214413 [Macroventuria anomochaeta]
MGRHSMLLQNESCRANGAAAVETWSSLVWERLLCAPAGCFKMRLLHRLPWAQKRQLSVRWARKRLTISGTLHQLASLWPYHYCMQMNAAGTKKLAQTPHVVVFERLSLQLGGFCCGTRQD